MGPTNFEDDSLLTLSKHSFDISSIDISFDIVYPDDITR